MQAPHAVRIVSSLLAVIATLALAGCASVGDRKSLSVVENQEYTQYLEAQQRLAAAPVDLAWWRSFGDPMLDALVQEASEQNLDLAIARLRLEQARANRRAEIARLGPRLDVGGSISAQRQSETSALPVGDVPEFEAENVVYEAGFDAEWELDLFGRNQIRRQNAEARVELAQIDSDAALVSVVSDIAREYFEYRLAQLEIAQWGSIIEQRESILTMVRRRYEQGEASLVDVEQESAALAEARARLPDVKARLLGNLYRLDTLIGRVPGTLEQRLGPPGDLPSLPNAIPVGLASDLLRRRTDVREAETNYAIAENDRALAELEFFPRFTLFGSAGTETTDLAEFFDPSSLVANLTGLIGWTLFDGGERSARRDAAATESDIAALTYRATVLGALEEVESQAAQFVEAANEADRLAERSISQQRLLGYERRRWEQGTANRVDLARADIAAYESALQSNTARAQALIDLVALQKSLGGTWQTGSKSSAQSASAGE